MSYRLITTKGCGSAIVEAALELADLPYTVDEINYDKPGPAQDRLRAVNPLGQVPTLILPDGRVMTESAAIVLHIADGVPQAGLVPAADDPQRPVFLRWLLFLVAAIYPTFTYGDDPGRWVPGAAGSDLRASTDAHREKLWRHVETQIAAAPWWLGEHFSVLDIYISVMSRWRPRRDWFAENCPKLHGIALKADTLPGVAKTWARNYG